MQTDGEMSRRGVLAAGMTIALAASAMAEKPQASLNPDEGVTAPEDLMKQHGVLNRCLLIYEEGMRRIRDGEEVSPNVFNHTAQLVRRFVEEYHEKNEENYIFPVFKKHGKLVDLVETLLTQHKAGRVITN
jgi:hemerythrin-like domain-containing protein